MLTLQGLRVFVAVSETGGIAPAADRLGRTPSAISMSLKQMEDSLGGPLFQGDRKTHLTTLGNLVLEQAREVILHFDSACLTMAAFARNQVGRCEVACVTSVSIAFLPAAIARVQQRLPGFGVHVRQMESKNAPNAILDGTVDIAFASRLSVSDDLEFTPLFRDSMDVVCRASDPLAATKGPLPWSALGERPFINNDSFHSVAAQELQSTAQEAQLRGGSVASVIAMVREGLGISVLPRLCQVQGADGLCFLPLQDPAAFRIVGLLAKRERRQLAGTLQLAAATIELIGERADELRYTLLPPSAASPLSPPAPGRRR